MGRQEDLAALQALTCAEELAADSAVSTWLSQALGLPEPGDGPEAWAQFLVRWADAIDAGLLARVAGRAAAAFAALGELDLSMEALVALGEVLRQCLAEELRGDEERRAVTEPDARLARVVNLRPATVGEEVALQEVADQAADAIGAGRFADLPDIADWPGETEPQSFRDAVAQVGGFDPKDVA